MLTMRAAFYEQNGPAGEVLNIGEVDVPPLGAGEVRIRVHISGVNPSDVKSRAGLTRKMTFPRVIPHSDGSGVIEAVGAGVSPTRIGERVWTYSAAWQRPFGTCAEYVVIPAEHAVRLPQGISDEEGACLGIPATTAHRALFADGSIMGQTVLVTGGAGAVGNAAIQLAKWGGATVISTVSSAGKADAARDAGADCVINYKTEDVAGRVLAFTGGQPIQRVVDVGFGANLESNLALLAPNGVIASYAADGGDVGPLPFRQLLTKAITLRFVLMYILPEQARDAAFTDINKALEAGALRSKVAQTFPLDAVVAAHELVENSQAIGNVLVRVGG